MEDIINNENSYGDRKPPIKKLGGIIHLAAWGILFCMPMIFAGNRNESLTFVSYLRFIIVPTSFIFIFYSNYLYLVRKYIFTRRTVRFIITNILLIALTMFLIHLLLHLFPDTGDHLRPERTKREIIGFFIGNSMIYMLVAGLSVAIKMTDNWFMAESARKELEKRRSEAELQNLKSQLNPHFLFNTLNNIYSLIAISPERAQESVHDLSRLLRYVLYESSQPYVQLSKDLNFIRNYIELMRIRLPKHVEVNVDIQEDINYDVSIAPLLFISLIENAFKHGVNHSITSFIWISIHVNKQIIECTICNSFFPKDNVQDKSGSGIGLQNLRKRLELLYPGKYNLVNERIGDQYKSSLSIELSNIR